MTADRAGHILGQADTRDLNQSFRRGFAITFTADLATKAFAAVTVVVLIRGLSISAYAYAALFFTVAQFTGSAAGSGVRLRYLRQDAERVSRGTEDERDGSFELALIKGTLLISALGACALLVALPLHLGVKFGGGAALIVYATVFSAGFAATELAIARNQARRQFASAGRLNVARAAALLAAAVIITATHQTLGGLNIWLAGSMVLVGVLTAAPIVHARLRQHVGAMRRLTFRGEENWLMVYSLAAAGFAYVDVMVAGALLNPKQVATLGAALRYWSIALGAIPAIGAILRVRTSQVDLLDSVQAQRDMVLGWLRRAAVPVGVIVGLGVLLAPWGIPIVDGGRYPGSIVVLQILLITVASAYLTAPAANVLMAQRRYPLLATIYVVGLAVNLLGDVLVARRFGVTGIAIVSSSAYIAVDFVMTLMSFRGASTLVGSVPSGREPPGPAGSLASVHGPGRS